MTPVLIPHLRGRAGVRDSAPAIKRRSPFNVNPALAGREVLVLKAGVRGKLLQNVFPVL